MGTMAEKGNGEEDQVSFCFSFFFSFNGISCVNLTSLVTSEVINDCSFFFISVRGRRRPVIPFEQTFIAYAIVDSYN